MSESGARTGRGRSRSRSSRRHRISQRRRDSGRREVGTIRKLTPIKTDGSNDNERKPTFTATTNIMTPNGALPLSGEIKATTLEEAISNFSDAINEALKKLQDDMIKMQQEQANKIVTPDDLRGNKDLII